MLMGWDSIDDIMTCYGLEGLGIESIEGSICGLVRGIILVLVWRS
jgi:hypothetical protein